MISKKVARELGKKYNINFDVVPFDEFHYGLNVELEHSGILGPNTNVTNGGDPVKTFKIVLAHLYENPFYYKYLKEMEKKADKYWSNRVKPNIFNE